MTKHETQSVMKGSAILLAATLLVKFIGAAFKIPLTNLIGNEGMGYFNSAYSIYSGLFVIATAGLPVAVSKMVSESIARNNLRETKRIFSIAYVIFLTIGVVGSAVLFWGADMLVSGMKYADSGLCVKLIAPAILFVSLMSVYRGFFQGTTNMLPTAISEVTEALGKLVVGLLLAYILLDHGLMAAAGGAVFGVTSGTFIAVLILMIIYQCKKKSFYSGSGMEQPSRPVGTLLWKLLKIAVPITISASVLTLTNLIDLALIGIRLDSIQEFLNASPTELYGMYSAKAVTLYNMPPTLVTSLSLPLVPAVSRAFVLKDYRKAQITISQSLKVAMLFELPCAVGMGVLAVPILELLYGTSDAALLLKLVSPSILFVSMVLVSNSILQAAGKVWAPVGNIAVAGIAKVLINYSLVGNPAININGAPIGTSVCYLIYMSLNLYWVVKVTGTKLPIVSFWLKPMIAAAVMGVVAYVVNDALFGIFAPYGRLGMIVTLAGSIGSAGIVYVVLLLLIGGITAEEIGVLPKGEKIAALLKKMKLLR